VPGRRLGHEYAERVPELSIVVPVHNVADYLAECLESILGQPGADVEVIAVDDASTDDSPAILEKYAAADPRLDVLRLEGNVGLGRARNVGIARASGRYLMFVDSDDALEPGALQAIAARIGAAGDPDVVMFGFARVHPDGRAVLDPRSNALGPPAIVRAADRPDLLEIIPSAWNKAYRREFIARWGFTFAAGYYEDVPWTYPLLMAADRIATLDRVCYRYRQRTDGSILSSAGQRHLEIFSQYDAVFAFIDRHPEFQPWRQRVFDRLSRHIPTILDTDRIPAEVRREFFLAASAAFRRHRPAGYLPGGAAGLKVRLIERGDYRAYQAAQLANRVGRRLRAGRTARGVENAAGSAVRQRAVQTLFDFVRADVGMHSMAAALPDLTAADLHRQAGILRDQVDDAAILRYAGTDVTDEMRLAVLVGIPGRTGHSVPRVKSDPGRGLNRVSYLFNGAPPFERYTVDGVEIRPAHAKTRAVDFFGRTLVTERIAWVPSGAQVRVDSSGEVALPAPSRPSRLARYRRVITENPGLALRLAGDLRIRRRARTPAARSAYADAWLLMDRDTAAQDNAEHLYRHLRQHEPDVNAWFVLGADSPDWPRLQVEGFRLLGYGSTEHFVALLNCAHLISSQVDSYVVKPFRKHALGRPRWRFTFLQHGVIKHDLSRWLNAKPLDLFTTSTPQEHRSIVGDGTPYVFTDLETVMTGLARYDRLGRLVAAGTSARHLLVMPTWRQELLGPQGTGNERPALPGFWTSDYAHAWLRFLESDRLAALCRDAGWDLIFLPHPNMQGYLAGSPLPAHVQGRRFSDVDVQALVAGAAAVVTDYSSLAFDAAYAERPVVYYQFDRAGFFSGRLYGAGRWDYARDGFGPVTETASEAVTALEQIARGGPDSAYLARMQQAFVHRDGRCCERIVAAIRGIDRPASLPD
jgi:glycosyltransferase involved in cell wall biosynthesis